MMTSPFLLIGLRLVIAFLTAFSVYQLMTGFYRRQALRDLGNRLKEGEAVNEVQSLFYRLLQPLSLILRPLAKLMTWAPYRKELERRIVQAGLRGALTFEDVFGYKAAMAVVFYGVGVLLSSSFLGLVPGVFLILGFFFPDLWLGDLVKQRHQELIRELPYSLDLLTLSVEAGMDFQRSVDKVVQKSKPSVLRLEFGRFLSEMQLGGTRQEALRHLSERNSVIEMQTVCALLIQADELGSSIGTTLRALSEKMQLERFQRAERMGALAAQKILFPLVFFIFPAVFIMILGPLVLRFLYR